MTLTDLLPTLRDSIPIPLVGVAWPVGTTPAVGDVLVSGISMRRFADVCGTPCVCTGVEPRGAGCEGVTILLVGVVEVRDRVLRLDGDFHGVRPSWDEVRILGRVSHAPDTEFVVPGSVVRLPTDMRVGDVLAVPCPGYHGVGDLRRAA